ncbi:DNA polymerase alpha subunit B [Arctopsyche grandis]|uniref:DNA polymerase alpha subunit B n=1 Tax=Arctopsyche grandis TaxID=121162 RepID=UPI00406D9E5F
MPAGEEHSQDELSEQLEEHLAVLGLALHRDHLLHMVECCRKYDLSAEEAAEQWAAVVLSDSASTPVPRLMLQFDRQLETSTESHASHHHHSLLHIDDDENILADYLTTPKIKTENIDYESPKSTVKSEVLPKSLRPITYTPATSQSEKYSNRTNAGDVLNSYGDEEELKKCTWTNASNSICYIQQVPNHSESILSTNAMYGFESLQNKTNMLDYHIKYLSEYILHRAVIKDTVPVVHKSQVPITIVGRIDCDSNGRLNQKSVVIQGTHDQSYGMNVPVNLNHLKEYTLFPGQVVALSGLNVQGDVFEAQQVFLDGSFDKANAPVLDDSLNGQLQMVVVCGPFTTSDSLTYDPLTDLIQYVTENKPHVVTLIGPFLHANHPLLLKNTIAETFKSFFENLVEKIVTAISAVNPQTQIVLVASSKDVFHTNIYPTPPFHIKKSYPNLMLVPDPCVLNVSGVNIGVTSTDIMMHLSKEEISMPPQGQDKMGRLASQLLNQQNFYPLYPPNPSMSLDTTLWSDYAALPFTPHILILPSDFRYFTKNINGCLIVNPERLTKGIGAGTFTRIQINSKYSSDAKILCQILRI